LISVSIPTYKRANYLKIGLESIFSQTLLPGEIVISVDGDDPATLEVIRSFENRHPSVAVKHFLNMPPIGERANRQRAFQLTSGDFVTMLDDDDAWHHDFLEKAYRCLQQNPDCGFSFGTYLLIDANGNPLERMSKDVDDYCGRSRMAGGKRNDVLMDIISYEALPFTLSCTLFRRQVLETFDFVPTYCAHLVDLAMFTQLGGNRVNGYYIAEPLAGYRVHPGQATSWRRILNSISKVECFYEAYRQFKTILSDDELNLLKRRYQSALMECVISHLHDSKRKEALRFLLRFFKLGFGVPSLRRTVVFLALFMGIHNKSFSIFRNRTPQLRYDNE
jgi:glycosyltransferase involved in cell wall biosynthesis